MKISKVEIQAFRAYDELKDCTFDFTQPDGSTADFVSLYAPNGFGKTSFYDAIEWGVTANIYRFIRQTRIKNYASDEKHLNYELANKKSPQYILRNKQSPPDRESFVRLHLLDHPEPKERALKKGRIDSTDYLFDESKTEERKFRDVILSQDSIDAFLREDDPGERYVKFMGLFGDADLNRIYTNVLCLVKANEHNIETLENERRQLTESLPDNVDNQILEKINTRINALIEKQEKLRLITPDFSENDFLNFSDTIAERLIELQNELLAAKTQSDLIREQQLKSDEYFLLQKRNALDSDRLKTLEKLLNRFQDLSQSKNRLAHIVLQLNKTAAERKEAADILRQFPAYLSRVELINQQLSEIESQKGLILKAEQELTRISNLLSTAQTETKQVNDSLYNLIQLQSDLPALEKLNDDLALELQQVNEQLKQLASGLEENEQETQKRLELQIVYLDLIAALNNNNFDVKFPEAIAVNDRIPRIKNIEEELKANNARLKQAEEAIVNQTTLNNELKQLVLLSSAYITKSNSDTCPVCLHQYENYEELSQRVLSNPLLNQRLQEQIQLRNEINTAIAVSVNSLSEIKKEILDLLNRELANLKNATTRLNLQKNQLASQRDTLRKKLQQVENRRRGIFNRINGESFSAYSEALQRQLEQLQKSAQEKTASITTLQNQLGQQKNFIESWKKTIQNIETGIKSYRLTDEYINVDQFLRKKGYLEYGLEQIKGLVTSLQADLDKIIAYEQTANDEVRNIAEELKDHNEIKLQTDIEALRQSLAQNGEITKSFERFVSQFVTKNTQMVAGTERNLLGEAEKNTETEIQKLQALIEEFEKIEEFKNNLMPLLRYMTGQRKIEKLSRRITFLTEKVRQRLEQEKNRLAAIIDQQIQSFFYEDLINQLYKKIDPHPNYKTIKFKCDFSDLKPKLNVFVSGAEDEYIIPNLYFSTAQTNILSLSIFLAKALNARDDKGEQINCIFIDDPIQSLDSINILSTIDLIRSLVVNFEKQIILSTHDENFHHLLQKKMPSPMFNSKFLELETFGKVKN